MTEQPFDEPIDVGAGKQWEMYALADVVLSGAITPEMAERLDGLLCNDQEARRHYVEYLYDSASFCHWSSAEAVDPRGMMNDTLVRRPAAPAVSAPIHHSTFSIPYFNVLGSAALSYGLALLLLAAGVLAAWTWRLPNGRSDGPANGPPQFANGTPVGTAQRRVALITGAVDCHWADAGTAIEPGAVVRAGRRFALASGMLQIWYKSRVEVILQGPAVYEADSPHGGFLSLGRLTARVEKIPETGVARAAPPADFTVRTPSAILANQDTISAPGVLGAAEFGVIVDSPRVTRVHVFRGRVTARLPGAPKDARAVPLAAGQSTLLARGAGPGMTDLGQAVKMSDVLFARRGTLPVVGQRENLAWLTAAGAGRQRQFVAVGSGEDFELPPEAVAPEPAQPAANAAAASGAASGIIYTCRLTFDLGKLNLATVMLRCGYVARNSITAVRLNGKSLPRPRPSRAAPDGRATETGEFLVHGGLQPGRFVPGTNVLEIDVNNALPSKNPPGLLWLRPEVSGIGLTGTRYPAPAGPATAEGQGRPRRTSWPEKSGG